MAVDPYIARGIVPIGAGLTDVLAQTAGLNIARERNALAERSFAASNALADRRLGLEDRRLGLDEQQFQTQQQQQLTAEQLEKAKRDAGMVYDRIEAGDQSAIQEMLDGLSGQSSGFANLVRTNREQAIQAGRAQMEAFLGRESKKPMPTVRNIGLGVQVAMQGDDVLGTPQWPQRAPLPGAETFSPFTDESGSVHFMGNRGSIRGTPLRGRVGGSAERPSDTGMKASDSNAIVSASARAFGGVYDPLSGNISGLKQDDLLNLNRVASRASNLFLEGNGRIPHATAVQQALEEMRGGGDSGGGLSPRRPAEYANEADAQRALEAGELRAGDTVYINGKPAFRVE